MGLGDPICADKRDPGEWLVRTQDLPNLAKILDVELTPTSRPIDATAVPLTSAALAEAFTGEIGSGLRAILDRLKPELGDRVALQSGDQAITFFKRPLEE